MKNQQDTKGQIMRKQRAALDLTQTELAEALGIRQNTVWRYEAGMMDVPPYMELAMEALMNRAKQKESKKVARKASKKSAGQ
jgi:DNA-binding XRE family transcriptional regulator